MKMLIQGPFFVVGSGALGIFLGWVESLFNFSTQLGVPVTPFVFGTLVFSLAIFVWFLSWLTCKVTAEVTAKETAQKVVEEVIPAGVKKELKKIREQELAEENKRKLLTYEIAEVVKESLEKGEKK